MPSSGVLVCRLPKLQLIPSVYSLTFTFHVNGTQVETFRDAISLEVESGDFYGTGLLPPPGYGFVLVNHEWRRAS
jgi:lipopolysaccharide transport system ATP-binding protein